MFRRGSRRARIAAPPRGATGKLSWLFGDKAPLYATLFFTALAWTFVRTIDQLAATPFVEYRIDPHAGDFTVAPGQNALGIRLRNMTEAKAVNCMTLYVYARNDKFNFLDANSFMRRGTLFTNGESRILDVYTAEISLTEFPPGGDIEFGFATRGEGALALQVKGCDGATATSPPIIVERSLQTWMIVYQLQLIWAALLLWAAFLVIMSAARSRTTDSRSR